MSLRDGFHDACGVFGIYGHDEAARMAYLGLYALQHRGQESAGIVSSDGERLYAVKAMGEVADVFDEGGLESLGGFMASGHVRYSTAGDSQIENAQPICIDSYRGQLALSHNGNLVNAKLVRKQLEMEGSIFLSTTDSEVILHLIARSREREIEDAIVGSLWQMQGAYSLIFQTPDKIIGVRDPYGFRPLVLGAVDGAHVICSESCALDLIDAKFVREIQPGEVIVIDDRGIRSLFPFESPRGYDSKFCIFELVYFARPDSSVFGRSVNLVRKEMGRQLARESGVEADLVVPVPDSGVYSAIGFAAECDLPFEFGLIRNHYVGRTFIEPKQSIRHFGVKVKLNAVTPLLKGKRVVLIDDSIVRGTTSKKIVEMVRRTGAREIHFRVSSPPTTGPCYYGIDTPSREELIASNASVEEIREYIGADSLAYLSLPGLLQAVEGTEKSFCAACFSGRYPIDVPMVTDAQTKLFEEEEEAS